MWKKYIYIPIMVMGVTLLNSCAKEDPLESKFEVKFGTFDFPQGTNSWDDEIMNIKEEYGTSIIYKDITEADMTRSWTGGFISVIPTADVIPEAEMDAAVATLRDRVLQYIPPKMAKAVLPPYIFLVTNYKDIDPMYFSENGLSHSLTGMDHWIISTKWHYDLFGAFVYDRELNRDFTIDILMNIYKNRAIPRGIIQVPAEFNEGMDFATEFDPNDDPTSPDYFLNRGFIHDGYLNVMITGEYGWNKPYDTNNARINDFNNYLTATLYFSKAEFEDKYPPEEFPLINKRMNIIYEMWDNIGIDMRQGVIE